MRLLSSVLSRIISHPLNREKPLGAVWRFVSWQVRARALRRPIVSPWIEGAKLRARIGDSGVTGNLYNGLQEFEDMAFLLHVLRPGDLFIDVGANAGAWTVLASKVVGARTVAFEPVPETFERLLGNLKVNDLASLVRAYNVGLGEGPGILSFSTDRDSMNRVLLDREDSQSSIQIKVDAIDRIMIEDATVMKIDVEGFELPVLKGSTRQLSQDGLLAIILETNGSGEKYGFSDRHVVSHLREFGYLPFKYDPWSRSVSALESGSNSSGNTIFLRNLELVIGRAKSGPPFEVNGATI